jgi:integrase
MRRGTWVPPDLRRVTVAEWSERWLSGARATLKPKTVASYESLLRSRILPTFGDRELRSVRPSDVGDWIGGMIEDGLSASRIRQAHVVLRVMLDVAVRDGLIVRNPATKAKLPRIEHTEAAYFEPHVVDSISEAVGEPYGVLVAILGTCGLRWGEAAALRGRHVDRLRRRLIVEESLAEISGRLVFGNTKSHARRRVPVPAFLLARIPGTPPDELVFTSPDGRPLRYRNFLKRVWHPTLETLGLPRVGVHVLRHSAAARIVAAGGSAKTLQTVLGHRSAAFSLTTYAHLFDADLDALANRLDEPGARRKV